MRVIVLPAGNASTWTGPSGNNTYLLPGRVPTLIDAGVGAPAHVDAVEEALRDRDLALVLITHGHPDHVGGVPALRAKWPAVRIRQAGSDPLSDGERIKAGDAELLAVHTPGHAVDHFGFFDERSRDFYCGDLARLGGTVVVPAGHGGNLAEYLASLRRVRGLNPGRLLPGHGPVVTDPVGLIDRYLEHRSKRDAQVLEALRAGCTTPEQIVPRIYGSLDPPLDRAAIATVLAHLIKLRDEGTVLDKEGSWSAAAPPRGS